MWTNTVTVKKKLINNVHLSKMKKKNAKKKNEEIKMYKTKKQSFEMKQHKNKIIVPTYESPNF